MNYDVVVIGAGPGGYSLALECGRRGMKTALVEKNPQLGGTCLNVGCIPSKALLQSSEFYYSIRKDAGTHGITVDETSIKLDLKQMMARKSSVVKKLTGGLDILMKSRKIDVIYGRGIIRDTGKLTVEMSDGSGEQAVGTKNIVLATGSVPTPLPGLPFDGKRIIDSTDAISLSKLPASLAVIGAGALGLEIASIWSRLGTKVMVIEAAERIITGADTEASRILEGLLKKQGIDIHCSTMVSKAEPGSRNVKIEMKAVASGEDAGSSKRATVDRVLVAIGRKANLESALGAGLNPKLTSDGRFFQTNEKFSTDIPGVFAIGDLIGNPMLAHKAEEEGLALAALLAGDEPLPWGGSIPNVVYTNPELAWAGKTEQSLIQSDQAYIKGEFSFAANGRAIASNNSSGFVKLLSSPNDRRLIGITLLCHGASELISEASSVMAMGGCAEDLALTVHAHPTFSEAIKEAALDLVSRPLHKVK